MNTFTKRTTTFAKKPLNLVVAAALGLFVSATAIAANPSKIANPGPVAQVDGANAINFSFAIATDRKLELNSRTVTTLSDEYYFTVSGSQLNKGIDIHTSQKGALIKISRQGERGRALENTALQLHSAKQPQKNLAANIIAESDLKATGIFTNATAIKLADDVQPGQFKLNYAQPLSAKNLYVIHVKEKNAVNKLELSAQKQHFVQGETFAFDAAMLGKEVTLALDTVEAFIMSPSGKKISASVNRMASGVAQISAPTLALDADAIEAPINGLYELHVNAMANSKGQPVRRSGKIAFALAPVTADLGKLALISANSKKPAANIALTVKEPGRYEVRGILFGHDNKGQLKPVMETHSAQNFVVGEQVMNMQFDQKILANSALKAPYVLQNVRLYDQTRMSHL